MARWCRGYWSSQGRVEKGWNWVAECNIQRPSQTPSLVVFIRHIISEVLQYRRHPFRARRHPWSEPDATLGHIGERYTMSSSSYPPTEPDAILGGLIRHMSQGRVCRLDAALVIPGNGRERVE